MAKHLAYVLGGDGKRHLGYVVDGSGKRRIAYVNVGGGSGCGGSVLYSNGRGGYSTNAWNIEAGTGFAVSNSFAISMPSTVRCITVTVWYPAGASPASLLATVTPQKLGGGVVFISTTLFNSSPTFLGTNALGYDVYELVLWFRSVALNTGTYWLTLSNAMGWGIEYPPYGIFWDQCPPTGTPNPATDAWQSTTGDLGNAQSESFAIYGTTP